MSAAPFEGSFLGDAARISPETKLECGVCWWVYDPEKGDDVWQIPPGVAFADLPKHWRCPNCDAEQHQFMVLAHGDAAAERPRLAAGAVALEKRVQALADAYRAVAERMRALPVFNERLAVETIGFRRWDDVYVGVVLTPWCMNLTRLPLDDAADFPPEGVKTQRALPSGSYEFVAGRLPEFGALETCSLFSPMEAFDDPSVARLVAEHAIQGAFDAPQQAKAAAEEATAEEAPAPAPAMSRRRFFSGAPAAS